MKTKRIELAGLTGTGKTKTEAKASLDRQIAEALACDYTPRLLRYKAHEAMIWRTPQGIVSSYRDVSDTLNGLESVNRGTCHHGRECDIESVVKSCALHLAMTAADVDTCDGSPAFLCAWPSVLADYQSWLGFQRAYRATKAKYPGAGEYEWHKWACDHGSEFKPRDMETAC